MTKGGDAMKVKLILPALTEAGSPDWRPIKYSLFPPLGLATLAAYLDEDDEITLQDEHVQTPRPRRRTRSGRHRGLHHHRLPGLRHRRSLPARGAHVALGGLHVTALPDEAARHADTIFLGPGEDTWPAFLADFRAGHPRQALPVSRCARWQARRRPRRDLIKRRLYLVPNSIVVSRGCPHACDFCYKEAFFAGGKSFYTRAVDEALAEIEALPGRHLFFLDDHLFGNVRFAAALFDGMRGMGRLWQAAGTVAGSACGRACWRRPRPAACAACSSASRPSARPTWPPSASGTTWTATTRRPSAACTIWA